MLKDVINNVFEVKMYDIIMYKYRIIMYCKVF